MWCVCCGRIWGKFSNKTVKSDNNGGDISSKSPISWTDVPNQNVNIDSTKGNGKQLNESDLQYWTEQRFSLPDIVIDSTILRVERLSETYSLQQSTRRPTLELETTALLAKSETLEVDEDTMNSVGSNSISNKTVFNRNSERKSNLPSNQERSSFESQKTRSRANKKRGSKVSTNILPMDHSEDNESFSASDNETKNETQDSDGDRLGQLPSSSSGNRFNRLLSRETPHSDSSLSSFQYAQLAKAGLLGNTTSPYGAQGRRVPASARRGSLCIFSHVDEPIVTPFAQILAGLRRVRSNFILLTNVSSNKE